MVKFILTPIKCSPFPGSDGVTRQERVGISADYTVRMGVNGYQFPRLHISQNDVATTYRYNLISPSGLLSAAQSMTASHASYILLSLSSLGGGLFTGSSAALSSSLLVNLPTSVALSLEPSFTGNVAQTTNQTSL